MLSRLEAIGDDLQPVLQRAQFHGVADHFVAFVNDEDVLQVLIGSHGFGVYQQRLGNGGYFTASPVIAGGKIYFTSEDGDVFVVKTGPQYELLAENHMGDISMATPTR